jgi:hypothetical protein
MSTVLTPPTPAAELDELCVLLGSQGAVARFLGRQAIQVKRWREGDMPLRPGTVSLIGDAWSAVRLISRIGGSDQVGVLVEQRWPALGYRSPAQCVRDGATDELIELLLEGAKAAETSDDDFAAWLGAHVDPSVVAPAPLEAVALVDDDDDDDDQVVPSLSTAWRGGGTMSSDRWFKKG